MLNLKLQLSNSDKDANDQVFFDTPDVLSAQSRSSDEDYMLEHKITSNQDSMLPKWFSESLEILYSYRKKLSWFFVLRKINWFLKISSRYRQRNIFI